MPTSCACRRHSADHDRRGSDARRCRAPPTACDLAYGTDPRKTLDLYAPSTADGGATVLLLVHGGGSVRGAKSDPSHPFRANAGRWAGRQGMVHAVMNYRLAPDHGWPSGGEDVGPAIDGLVAQCAGYGGDPARIVVAGTCPVP